MASRSSMVKGLITSRSVAKGGTGIMTSLPLDVSHFSNGTIVSYLELSYHNEVRDEPHRRWLTNKQAHLKWRTAPLAVAKTSLCVMSCKVSLLKTLFILDVYVALLLLYAVDLVVNVPQWFVGV